MLGKTLGRYRIVEKIGVGGMGEVYRARDEQLKRSVAIKVLLAGTLSDDQARIRFRKEAETLSRLNHPHIAQVYDFGSQGEVDYLVMEQVPGESLKEKLDKGSLPEKEVVRLGTQIADALQEAHEQGVVHRDLKPGNIKLTAKGQAKVLDFGIAKLLGSVTEVPSQTLSETQVVAGTLPYMAPEQLRGEGADVRSDIYSFGVVLYEMATGQRPFEQKLSTALSDAILHDFPPALRTLNRRLSPMLENIILKSLEKEPENRYQSAKELGVDLRRLTMPSAVVTVARPRRWRRRPVLGGVVSLAAVAVVAVLVGLNVGGLRERLLLGAVPGQITSLAVLPLENLSGDPEQEYFADGVTDAVITELGKIGALRVISRTSVMQYKGARKPLAQIAGELNVDAVVEGSAQQAGQQARITVRLIKAPTEKQLWSQAYQRDLSNILALQSEVARAIAQQIKIAVTPEEQARLASMLPVNPEAHEAYLRGRYHWNRRTEEGLKKSLEHFQQALEKDPSYASAYVGLADSYIILGNNGFLPAKETYPQARAAALKALDIDDNLAEAHCSLAAVLADYDWDWSGAEKEYRNAIALNPSYATAHHWYAVTLTLMGRREEALAEIRQARRLAPLAVRINANVGLILYFGRQYDEAIEELQRTLELEPNDATLHQILGWTYLQKGMHEQAITLLRTARTLFGDTVESIGDLGHAYAVAGKRDEALRILEELKELSQRRYVSPYIMALVYAGLNDKDQALAWLEKAYEDRSDWVAWLKVNPKLDPLRTDPRFQSLLRRMNFPE